MIGMALWCDGSDNDGVRFSLILGSAIGDISLKLLKFNLECKSVCNSTIWFARVPTEANLSDHPSRGVEHPLLVSDVDVTENAWSFVSSFLEKSMS